MKHNRVWMGMMLMLAALAARRDARLRLAMAQLEIAKARLAGNRVLLSHEERQRFLRLGSELNHAVHDAMGLVSVNTYNKRGSGSSMGAGSLARIIREKVL
jgi:hypothetical protein